MIGAKSIVIKLTFFIRVFSSENAFSSIIIQFQSIFVNNKLQTVSNLEHIVPFCQQTIQMI